MVFWSVYIPWGPHNVFAYNWVYRCYGNYNMANIKSVKGGKNSKTAINFTFPPMESSQRTHWQ